MMSAAKLYYAAIRDASNASPEERERLKVELDRLMMPFSEDPAYQAFIHMQRVASGLDGVAPHAAS
jgi:hypothetical protein